MCVSDKADLDESGTPVSLAAVTTRTPSLVRLDLTVSGLTPAGRLSFCSNTRVLWPLSCLALMMVCHGVSVGLLQV